MRYLTLCLAAVLLAFVAAGASDASSVKRSRTERAHFIKAHPCPATHQTRGACPGYVVDHIIALCKGGPDLATNMQWQTVADAKAKDKWECK